MSAIALGGITKASHQINEDNRFDLHACFSKMEDVVITGLVSTAGVGVDDSGICNEK